MNRISFLFIGFLLSVACSVTPYDLIRKFNARSYRPCQDFQTKEPVGKFCYRYCKKYKFLSGGNSKRCKLWASDVQDFSNAEVFKKFRDAEFILIQESRVR